MVTGIQLADKGVQLATGPKISYKKSDCQDFMEMIFEECGQRMSYEGSNDMFRNACAWIGTLQEAKDLGYLVSGVALFIHSFNGGEPKEYRADGKGNVEHVGMYIGDERAFMDKDKNGNDRLCNVVHSSASLGRVGGSTLKNAWTHVGLWKNVDYDLDVEFENSMNGDENMAIEAAFVFALVKTANGSPLNFRTKKSTKSDLVPRVPEIPNGAQVKVLRNDGEWCKISYNGYSGYVLSEFLTFDCMKNTNDNENVVLDDPTIGNAEETAERYRVYVDFTTKEEALAFQKAMQGCQVGSVK